MVKRQLELARAPITGTPAIHAAGWPSRTHPSTRERSVGGLQRAAAARAPESTIAWPAPNATCDTARTAKVGAARSRDRAQPDQQQAGGDQVTQPQPRSGKPQRERDRGTRKTGRDSEAPRHGGRHSELASHIRKDRSQHEEAGLGGEHSQKEDQGGLRAGTKRHDRTVRSGRPRAIGDTTQPMQYV
jgi:hypothetical protein